MAKTLRLRQRLALWAMQRAFPEASPVADSLRGMVFALAAATTGGVLLVLAAALGLAALYVYLEQEGVPSAAALLIDGGIALLAALLGYRKAASSGHHAVELWSVPESVSEAGILPKESSMALEGRAGIGTVILGGFMEGFFSESSTSRKGD